MKSTEQGSHASGLLIARSALLALAKPMRIGSLEMMQALPKHSVRPKRHH
jgi:hypothetical protein